MALPPRDGCDWSSSAIGAPSRPVPQESVSADECDPGPTGCQANTRWFSCCGTCRGSAEHPAVNLLGRPDRKSTRLNSSHVAISYAVFCLKKKNTDYSDSL